MTLGYSKKMTAYVFVAIFFVALDRFLKILAVKFFGQPFFLVNDTFSLKFSSNYNIAFSLPVGGAILNIVVILIIVGLLYNLFFLLKRQDYKKSTYLIFIIFGAISNLADRLKFGYVVDYFDLKYFTVFNIADMMIVGGVAGLIWLLVKK